jgi:hypothetical protein
MGDMRNSYKILGEEPKWWENTQDLGTAFNEIGSEGVDCIHLV